MTNSQSTSWDNAAITLMLLCLALGFCTICLGAGCSSLSGTAPLDSELTNSPIAGILGDVIGTNFSPGVLLSFPTNIEAEVQALLNGAGAVVVSNTAVLPTLTGSTNEAAAIKAALIHGATITGAK